MTEDPVPDAAAEVPGAVGSEQPPASGKPPKDPDAGNDREARQKRNPEEQTLLGEGVFQNFNGGVYAPFATFGTSAGTGGDEQRVRARDEGPVEESDIAAIVRAYAKPACYEDAEMALREKHVVILTGNAGSGRRAGAIVMLDTVRSGGKPLVRINPSMTIERLATRPYNEGVCYLISEKFADQIEPELAEFHWDALYRKIRASKAHLVVTAGAGSIRTGTGTIDRIPWERVDAADALRAHLGAAHIANDIVHKVAEAVGTDHPLSDIGRIARRILEGEDLDKITYELRCGDQQVVTDWLDDVDAAIPAVLEVAALAFVLGVPERVFEDEVADLKLRMADFAPELDAESNDMKAQIDLRFLQLRKRRAQHKLLTITQVPIARSSGSIAVRHVDFRESAYRQHIIVGLWNSLGRDFWSGMRGWLHDLAAAERYDAPRNAELLNSAAAGLALLALVAPDEVIDSYLVPWTADDSSASEQTTALYIVWQMSTLDQMAPLALRIAILWAGQGTRTQRSLAAYAFSGELGARYPVEATDRLSQLADEDEPTVSLAFSRLFATLVTQGEDAVVVLRKMRRRMAEKTNRRSAGLVLDMVVDLVSVRDFLSGYPAVAVFVKNNPGRVAEIGPLWARALHMRPWRERSIKALVATARAIAKPAFGVKAKQRADEDIGDLARMLGAAIGRELPPLERAPLRSEIARWLADEWRREKRDRKPVDDGRDSIPSPDTDEVLKQLLNAIEHPFPRELEK